MHLPRRRFLDVAEMVGRDAHLLLERLMENLTVVLAAQFPYHFHLFMEKFRVTKQLQRLLDSVTI